MAQMYWASEEFYPLMTGFKNPWICTYLVPDAVEEAVAISWRWLTRSEWTTMVIYCLHCLRLQVSLLILKTCDSWWVP